MKPMKSKRRKGSSISEIDPWGLAPCARRPHSAKFSEEIIPILAEWAKNHRVVLDPLAGVGKVGRIKGCGYTGKVIANELEREWANQCSKNGCDEVLIGDAATAKYPHFDCVVTSPTYGNRMADNFRTIRPTSMRGRYAGDLGRTPSAGSACCLRFGSEYQETYRRIFKNVVSQLPCKGRVIVNVSDFFRIKKRVPVCDWWRELLSRHLGLVLRETVMVKTRRMGHVGANTHLRVDHEEVIVLDKR